MHAVNPCRNIVSSKSPRPGRWCHPPASVRDGECPPASAIASIGELEYIWLVADTFNAPRRWGRSVTKLILRKWLLYFWFSKIMTQLPKNGPLWKDTRADIQQSCFVNLRGLLDFCSFKYNCSTYYYFVIIIILCTVFLKICILNLKCH